MPQVVPLIETATLSPGESRLVTVGGRELAVFHLDNQFHVLDNHCPHAGGPLAEGTVEAGVVTCPWHAWKFDVASGRCLTHGLHATRLSAHVEDGWVKVELD